LENIELTPKGDTKGLGHMPAMRIKVASGIKDALNVPKYTDPINVVNGVAEFDTQNYAVTTDWSKVPPQYQNCDINEHLWVIGNTPNGSPGFIVFNPNNPLVIYPQENGTFKTDDGRMADLENLAIGITFKKNGQVVPIKNASRSWAVQGLVCN
jgi:hypothetical protein